MDVLRNFLYSVAKAWELNDYPKDTFTIPINDIFEASSLLKGMEQRGQKSFDFHRNGCFINLSNDGIKVTPDKERFSITVDAEHLFIEEPECDAFSQATHGYSLAFNKTIRHIEESRIPHNPLFILPLFDSQDEYSPIISQENVVSKNRITLVNGFDPFFYRCEDNGDTSTCLSTLEFGKDPTIYATIVDGGQVDYFPIVEKGTLSIYATDEQKKHFLGRRNLPENFNPSRNTATATEILTVLNSRNAVFAKKTNTRDYAYLYIENIVKLMQKIIDDNYGEIVKAVADKLLPSGAHSDDVEVLKQELEEWESAQKRKHDYGALTPIFSEGDIILLAVAARHESTENNKPHVCNEYAGPILNFPFKSHGWDINLQQFIAFQKLLIKSGTTTRLRFALEEFLQEFE